jgi:hypothetical protein
MLIALVVMAGFLLLTMVVNNRRQPSRWDNRHSLRRSGRAGDGLAWAYCGDSGGDSGGDCGGDPGGGSCDGPAVGELTRFYEPLVGFITRSSSLISRSTPGSQNSGGSFTPL